MTVAGAYAPMDRAAIAVAPLDVQAGVLERIVRDDADLMILLELMRDAGLPDAWLASGAIYQTVWNRLTGRPPRTGIKDYDIVYFDAADLSYEAEDRMIRHLAALAAPFGLAVEVRNQARVHLWFEARFGFAMPPLTCSAESLLRYASTTHAVACRLSPRLSPIAPRDALDGGGRPQAPGSGEGYCRPDGPDRSEGAPDDRMEILAPFGLADVFAMVLRPNRRHPNGPTHDAKARRFLDHWPELAVEWW